MAMVKIDELKARAVNLTRRVADCPCAGQDCPRKPGCLSDLLQLKRLRKQIAKLKEENGHEG